MYKCIQLSAQAESSTNVTGYRALATTMQLLQGIARPAAAHWAMLLKERMLAKDRQTVGSVADALSCA